MTESDWSAFERYHRVGGNPCYHFPDSATLHPGCYWVLPAKQESDRGYQWISQW